MQSVPSLVGTGTIVAAAAAGLIFAQPADDVEPWRPSSPQANSNMTTHVDGAPHPYLSSSSPAARSLGVAEALDSTLVARDGECTTGSSDETNVEARRLADQQLPLPQSGGAVIPSSAATLPRSAMPPQVTPPKQSSRRHSFIHRGEWLPPPISEVSRDSISSNGSWIRRLSIRPLSQHGSPRSSVGPDSPSLNFSLGSAAPILLPSTSSPPQQQQQPRNKLVKRTTAGQDSSVAMLSRRSSRTQMPALRRPATSHQRSATLQQVPQFDGHSLSPLQAEPSKYSFDQTARPSSAALQSKAAFPETSSQTQIEDACNNKELSKTQKDGTSERNGLPTAWVSFFHERLARGAVGYGAGLSSSTESSPASASPQQFALPGRTLVVQNGRLSRVYLATSAVLPAFTSGTARRNHTSPYTSVGPNTTNSKGDESSSSQDAITPPQETPSRKARKSISMHFSSPSSWMSRSGSLRRPKRGATGSTNAAASDSKAAKHQRATSSGNTRRHVSAPLPQPRLQPEVLLGQLQPRNATAPANIRHRDAVEDMLQKPVPRTGKLDEGRIPDRNSPILLSSSDARLPSRRQRNSSSPLPPLSRLSSFNVDLSRLSATSSSASAAVAAVAIAQMEKAARGSSQGSTTSPRAFPLLPQSRDISFERSPNFTGSDSELQEFGSHGDDDDTDFKSDTMFDSVRTEGSARHRITDTPIESMFDESPPSTASNSKTKRLSIQEILGQSWDSDTKIMEEDEGAPTPVYSSVVRSASPTLSSHRFEDPDFFLEPVRNIHNVDSSDTADAIFASSTASSQSRSNLSFAQRIALDRLSFDGDDDDDWSHMDENGVINHLSPPSRPISNSLKRASGFYNSSAAGGHIIESQRSALVIISGNGSPETVLHPENATGDRERPRSSVFDWSESTLQLDKPDVDGQSPRPKTVHGKQEMDVRSGRLINRKGPTAVHVRSQSVPVVADPTEGAKPAASKFGTWASGPKNTQEDWDDDFDFEAGGSSVLEGNGRDDLVSGDGGDSESRAQKGKGLSAPFSMIVPASIQATQPTVKAHSGQIRELSLLVNGLKRLCRHARDLDIISESPALWLEAENIIALASPDEDTTEGQIAKTNTDQNDTSNTTATEHISSGVNDRLLDDGFDAGTLNSFETDSFDRSDVPQTSATRTPPALEMDRNAVVRERQSMRRRSVFSPEDDIFGGGWLSPTEETQAAKEQLQRPQTPSQAQPISEEADGAVIESIMEAMQQQRSASVPAKNPRGKQTSQSELFFNTNTLQELVKRANSLFHNLSDIVRRAELLTQSPACTPRHERHHLREDGSPAFTRVFTDPSSPTKRLPQSHSSNSVIGHTSPSIESPASNSMNQRLQMMTVN